jgi:hypothetical protein
VEEVPGEAGGSPDEPADQVPEDAFDRAEPPAEPDR